MRTTITLDPDVEALLKQAAAERGATFKETVNDAIRRGLRAPRDRRRFRQGTFDMGRPLVDVTKASQLAGDLEDEELRRKISLRK